MTAPKEQRFVLCVAASPNRYPKRGADHFVDIASPEVIEAAAWRFMAAGAKAGLMHQTSKEDDGKEPPFRVVESSIFRSDTPWEMTATDGTKQTVRKGDWICGLVLREDVWQALKRGEFAGASIQGKVRRVPATRRTLSRQIKE